MAPKKRVYKSRGPRAKKAYKSKVSVPLAVKKYVKKAMAVATENKVVSVTASNSFGSYAESPDLNAYPMMPYVGYLTIPQGVTQGTRIGNQVKIRRVMLNYVLFPTPYNGTTNTSPQPLEVLMFLGTLKRCKGDIPFAPDFTNFYQLGATSTAPTGTILDACLDVNKDFWDIKKSWKHKLGYSNYDGVGTSGNYQRFANNDYKLSVVRKLDITKLCPSSIKFDDSNTATQGNNLFLMYQAVSANGQGFGALQAVAQLNFCLTVTYEDA